MTPPLVVRIIDPIGACQLESSQDRFYMKSPAPFRLGGERGWNPFPPAQFPAGIQPPRDSSRQ